MPQRRHCPLEKRRGDRDSECHEEQEKDLVSVALIPYFLVIYLFLHVKICKTPPCLMPLSLVKSIRFICSELRKPPSA
jgi:hypothetical protein